MNTLEKAMLHGKSTHPGASPQKHAAFANAVSYLVTGYAGGYGGPSVREHAVSHALAGMHGRNEPSNTSLGLLNVQYPDGSLPSAGEWSFEAACEFADPIIFGPLTDLHRHAWRSEHCFDNDPEDETALNASSPGLI